MWPSQHGAWSLGTKLFEDVPTVGDHLQNAGYRTALVGKAHFQPLASKPGMESIEAQPTLRDLDFWRKFKGPWYGFEHVETARMHCCESHAGGHYGLWLEEKGLKYCYLDGSTKDRMRVVREFNTDRSIPVFLISLKAGGTGLNLVGADMVVHFDPWWNPAVEDQATDRAYRIGQNRTVYNIKLIARGTVEEKVLKLQQQKRLVIDATVENDEKMMSSMKWEDIQYLLSL